VVIAPGTHLVETQRHRYPVYNARSDKYDVRANDCAFSAWNLASEIWQVKAEADESDLASAS